MIDLKTIHKTKRTKQELIEGMVLTLLERGYSVNEIQQLMSVPRLLEVENSILTISDAKGDNIF